MIFGKDRGRCSWSGARMRPKQLNGD
jgi:hypothetical protein